MALAAGLESGWLLHSVLKRRHRSLRKHLHPL